VGFPSAQIVAASPFIDKARGLVIENDCGNWVGFCTTYPRKTITRFSWGVSLASNPVVSDLGNVGGLTDPMQPALIRDNSGWYLFVANTTSLSQLDFGNSLLNIPSGVNYGNMGWMTDDRGISLFMECNNPYGFITNHNLVDNLILQINFKGGITGSKSITPLGSVANLYLPSTLSESLNVGDTIYTVVLNESTMTTLYFPPCSNSPFPPSTSPNPSPIRFHDPGKYTVKLTVDMGLPTEQTVCREIYVDATPPVHLGNDTTICEGTSLKIDAGTGFTNYLWNTGEITKTITVDTAGKYSVFASKTTGCHSEDTIRINISQKGLFTIDTAVCFGEKYFAGGKWQTKPGTFYDTLFTKYHCDSILTTNLTVKPEIVVNIEKDTCIYIGNTYKLTAHASGAATWLWRDGSQDSVFTVHEPGKYWVTAYINACHGSDTAIVKICPALIFFPSAFTPNGDGLNDYFQPKGTDINDFYMIVFDRWGHKVFETTDPGRGWDGTINGTIADPDVYTFIATYRDADTPGETRKIAGSLTLVR
ncbi:MAG: gliding motility-associated C-terminal domain-containing protein, partial [Bacteroidota bacterium]